MISEQIGLDLLRSYVAVCRLGSLSRAAAQTGRTQSALSMQMRRLETLLGQRLLQRTGRGVVPTGDGEVFLGYAVRMLALGDEAQARLTRTDLSGEVRVGLAEEVATAALPAALGRLYRAHPDVRLHAVVAHAPALGQDWRDYALDVMVAPATAIDADALISWNVEMVWTAGRDWVPDRVLDLVAYAAPCAWRRRMVDALVASGRDHRITFTSQSVAAVQAAVESGLGAGLLPPEAVRPNTMRVLRAADGPFAPLTVQYGLYAHDRRRPEVDAALSALREALPAPPAR